MDVSIFFRYELEAAKPCRRAEKNFFFHFSWPILLAILQCTTALPGSPHQGRVEKFCTLRTNQLTGIISGPLRTTNPFPARIWANKFGVMRLLSFRFYRTPYLTLSSWIKKKSTHRGKYGTQPSTTALRCTGTGIYRSTNPFQTR